jgi:hypothetical protein
VRNCARAPILQRTPCVSELTARDVRGQLFPNDYIVVCCTCVPVLGKMAPRAKPAPHRLGPPPQLTSLKVPVLNHKFASQVHKCARVQSEFLKMRKFSEVQSEFLKMSKFSEVFSTFWSLLQQTSLFPFYGEKIINLFNMYNNARKKNSHKDDCAFLFLMDS